MDIQIPKKNFIASNSRVSQHSIFELILLIIISGLFYWFLIMPKAQQVKTASQQRQQLSGQYQQLMTNKEELENAVNDLKSHPQEVAMLDEALPLNNRVPELYIALESYVQSSGMTEKNVSVSFSGDQPVAGNQALLANPYTANRTLQKLQASVSVSGTMDQFQTLLQDFENSGRIMDVSAISIAQANGVLDFDINLQAYYYE